MDRTNPHHTIKCAVTAANSAGYISAQQLAEQLQLPFTMDGIDCDYLLTLTNEHLELRKLHSKETNPLWIDFVKGKAAYRRHHDSSKQLLTRAVGFKKNHPLSVIDATAGFGQDAFVLATLGIATHLLERSPIMSALLADGIARANAGFAKLTMTLTQGNSIEYLTLLTESNYPDVIYLDPMYPVKHKTALNKKAMRWLRDLVGDDLDAKQLLEIALNRARKRVVVKRPRLAPYLGEVKPSFSMAGKTCRFDIFIIHS